MALTESLWLVLAADRKRGQSKRSSFPRSLTVTNTRAVVREALLGGIQIVGFIRMSQDCFADADGFDTPGRHGMPLNVSIDFGPWSFGKSGSTSLTAHP